MKPLMPTLHENNRYISFEIWAKKQLSNNNIKRAMEEGFLAFLGQLELGKSSFKIINIKGNKGIIKVNAKYADKLRGMFTMMQEINNEKVNVKSIKTSGLIYKIKED